MSSSAQAISNVLPARPEDLAGILAPEPLDTFLSETFGQSFLHVQGEAGKFAGLLPWEELNAILEEHRLQPPRLRLTREGKPVPSDSYLSFQTDRKGQPIPRLNAAALTTHLREGATLVLDAVDELQRPVRRIAENLERVFRTRIQVNGYAGWRTSHGFDLHWDDHDVFVLQVAGRKHWKIYGQTRPYPLKRDIEPADVPPTEVLWEGLLEAGSMLYIPRGWWHVAMPLDEPTLHLTVGVSNACGADLLGWLAEQLKAEAIVRQDLPLFATTEARAAHAQALLDALQRRWNDGIIDEYLRDKDGQVRPRPNMHLPWSARPDVLPEGEWRVQWAVNRVPQIVDDADEITFDALDRRWRFARAARPLLEALHRGGPLTVDELSAQAPVGREPTEKLVRDLVIHGLVRIIEH